MLRNLALLLVLLGVGAGAQVAQSDIFVRQTPSKQMDNSSQSGEAAAQPQKKRLFLNPFARKTSQSRRNTSNNTAARKPAVVTSYRNRINTAGLQAQSAAEMRSLAYWQQRDTKPQNAVELLDYAYAQRSPVRAAIRVRQANFQARMDVVEANRYSAFSARMAARDAGPDAQIADQGQVIQAYTQYGDGQSDQSSNKTVRRVYNPQGTRLEKPQRVFTNYR